MSAYAKPPPIPSAFAAKKSHILAALDRPGDVYSDNSPKGSVDVQIQGLIDEINAYEGLVTTSSCAGRVAVFVEGGGGRGGRDERGDGEEDEGGQGGASAEQDSSVKQSVAAKTSTTTSPGGKGGGRWLFVSHDPLPLASASRSAETTSAAPKGMRDGDFFSLFNLSCPTADTPSTSSSQPTSPPPRLIHLSFSPLILHIHCATLQHARPLLRAAINAGFRESGVQSLRILDPAESERGVMVAIRTAGLSFETVVGVTAEGEGSREVIQTVVSEDYLRMCADVINQRFLWNEERRERLRQELRRAMEKGGLASNAESGENVWEDKDERKRRKREEGLARQKTMQKTSSEEEPGAQRQRNGADGLDEYSSTLEIG